MHKGRNFPLNASALISAAFPRNAAKQLERHIGCSTRQAWRIASTGNVPGRFRAAVIDLLDRQITKNREHLERLELELRAFEHEEMLDRAASRRASIMGRGLRWMRDRLTGQRNLSL